MTYSFVFFLYRRPNISWPPKTHLQPRLAYVVPVSLSDGNECLYSVDVLCFHLMDMCTTSGRKQREPGQSLHECISFEL